MNETPIHPMASVAGGVALRSVSVANFKAFGSQEQTMPLKPLTLIFGPNSSGKSSLIHALLLAHHAATGRGDLAGPRTRLGGDSVDLGGFFQYLHGRGKKEGEVIFGFDLVPPADFPFRSNLLRPSRSFRLEFIIRARGTEPPRATTIRIIVDGAPLLQIVQPEPKKARLNTWEIEHPLSQRLFEACLAFTPRQMADAEGQTAFREAVYAQLDRLELRAGEDLLPHDFIAGPSSDIPGTSEGEPTRMILDRSGEPGTSIQKAVDLFFERLAGEILRDLHDLLLASFAALEYLGPLRKLPRRYLSGDDLLSDKASGAFAWNTVMVDSAVRDKVNGWFGKDFLKTRYRLEVRSLVHVDEGRPLAALQVGIEEALAKLALGDAEWQGSLGPDWLADNLADLQEALQPAFDRLREGFSQLGPAEREELVQRHPNLRDRMEQSMEDMYRDLVSEGQEEDDGEVHDPEWIRRKAENEADLILVDDRGVQAELFKRYVVDSAAIQQVLGERSGATETARNLATLLQEADPDRRVDLRVIDLRSDTAVSHRDVGVGISQVLPVLVLAYGSRNKLIAIEQPEIHIHPALQAELGDVFIESALTQGNTFLLETHSEHLILRLLRRVRETTRRKLPPGRTPLRSEDIAILYVEPAENGAEVRTIHFDAHGNVRGDWPGRSENA